MCVCVCAQSDDSIYYVHINGVIVVALHTYIHMCVLITGMYVAFVVCRWVVEFITKVTIIICSASNCSRQPVMRHCSTKCWLWVLWSANFNTHNRRLIRVWTEICIRLVGFKCGNWNLLGQFVKSISIILWILWLCGIKSELLEYLINEFEVKIVKKIEK